MNKYISLFIVLLLCVNIGCSEESDAGSHASGVTFSINPPIYEIEETGSTRTLPDKVITHLWYIVLDKSGQIIHPPHQLLTPDLSKITLEGLQDGDYSIAILATQDGVQHEIPELNAAGEIWLRNPNADMPLDQDYLYKRHFFSIGYGTDLHDIQIELEHATGQVVVDIDPANKYSAPFIRKVEFSLDEGSTLYQALSGDGTYSNNGSIKELDITRALAFYSFPGHEALSGKVKITSVLSDSTTMITTTHLFSKLEIVPGKKSHIHVNYTHPEDAKGSFRVAATDYNKNNSTLILQNDEPRKIFTNQTLRNFRVNRPLKVSVNANKELQLQFYSAIPIHDVKILCKFLKYSNEYFELAHYDIIPAFHESRMPMPITQRNCTFRSADGRNIVIPALPELTDNDCSFRIETNDPYMAKIATIAPQWLIRFSDYSAGAENPGSWRHMTPYYCREACVLTTNMAYMFSHPLFKSELLLWDGKLKDNAGKAIPLEKIQKQLLNHPGLVMGLVGGVGGLGGGQTYGLAPYVYEKMYADAEGGVHTYSRMAAFHEYGHCLGYSHSSNMTYGDAWTVLCANVYVKLCKTKEMPVSSKTALRPTLKP